MTVALLPLAIASVLQGVQRARLDVVNIHERLLQSARAAASNEENILASAEQITRALANMPEVRNGDPEKCNSALSDALIGVRFFYNLTRVDAQGRVMCSALPGARSGVITTTRDVFERARATGNFAVGHPSVSARTSKPIIVSMLPLTDDKGRFQGTLAIALDIRWLEYVVHSRELPAGAVVAVFDKNTIVTTNDPRARSIFFTDVKRSLATGKLQSITDADNDRWSYVTAPLLGNTIYVGFAMKESHLFGPAYLHMGSDFLMPILMILFAWGAIWIATDRQVTQWILYLRRVAQAYRRGHYAVKPQLDHAPSDFKLLGAAMAEMAEAIQDRDKALREAVEQKTLLIREVHHRVKNNLQIVMSLLNLQAGQLKDPGARDALNQAQTRINALALVHRILNEIENQSTINLKFLLPELTKQIAEGLGADEKRIRLDTEVVAREVSGDIGVPLALFTVEALTNIFKHAFPAGSTGGHIKVALTAEPGGMLKLLIEDDGVGFEERLGKTASIGTRLIRTFGQQIGGTTTLRSEAGLGSMVELIFPDPTLKAA